MKVAVIVLVALAAMASAQDRVITNPDPGFYRPTNGQNGDQIVISNPDPGFYLPTNQNSNNGGYEPISSGPALVEGSRPNYPPKQYPSPYARDGK